MERCEYFRWQKSPAENLVSTPEYEGVCGQCGLFMCPPGSTCPIRERVLITERRRGI